MTREELESYPCCYVGLLKILKPRKGQKIGIAYADWHHLAIIDDVVFTFIWDSREIINCCPLSYLRKFDATNLTDMGTHLCIGEQTSERAKQAIEHLQTKYDLPIVSSSKPALADLKEHAQYALGEVNRDMFDIDNEATVVFFDKELELPEDMFMYKASTTLNPAKQKFMDTCVYQGRSKYLAIIARCSILKQIENLNL